MKVGSEDLKGLCCENDSGFTGFVVPRPELPKGEGGNPAGVKDPVDDGGGPAGVVEGFEAAKEKILPPWPDRLSGVDGVGLEENGTSKPDIAAGGVERSYRIMQQQLSNSLSI